MNLGKIDLKSNTANIFKANLVSMWTIDWSVKKYQTYFTLFVSSFDISAVKVVETFFLVTVYIFY